jgi:hypothetical protein
MNAAIRLALLGTLILASHRSALAGTVITANLPDKTAIVNIDARADGTASYNGDQSLWYHPFGGAQLLKYPVAAGTYSFRAVNPADAVQLFPTLTAGQTNQIFTAWTYNSPWILDYLVFDSSAETNYSVPQLFDGSPEWPPYSDANAAYSASLTNGYNNLIRTGPQGRNSTNFATTYTFTNAETLIFVIPDYALSDNSGGVSVLISPAVFTTTNLLLNPGAEAGSLTNWTAGGNSNPKVDNGTFDSGIIPHTGTNDFLAGTGSVGSLDQVVALVGNQGITAAAIDGGKMLAKVSFWEQGLNQALTSDDAYISLAFWNRASNVISTVITPEIDSHNLTWSNYSALYKIPAGTRYLQYTMNFVRHVGSDLDAFVDDNSLIVLDSGALPRLNIVLVGTYANVFWPTNFADGFTLQQNPNLATTNWVTSSYAISTVGGTNSITITPPTGNLFFRLKQ